MDKIIKMQKELEQCDCKTNEQEDFVQEIWDLFEECKQEIEQLKAENAEYKNKLADGRMVELPCKWLETLKLLVISSIYYKEWENIIISKIKDSKDIANLFFELPTVQYFSNDIKLNNLVNSKIDVNEITKIEEIINIFYPDQAKQALKEMEEK